MLGFLTNAKKKQYITFIMSSLKKWKDVSLKNPNANIFKRLHQINYCYRWIHIGLVMKRIRNKALLSEFTADGRRERWVSEFKSATVTDDPCICGFQSKTTQGTKLTFFLRRHLAPKYSKVVTKSEKLIAIPFSKNKNKKYRKVL